MSEIKVNKISPRSGTTVTLGDSGDTFTIPSGATINNQGTATNFGATGSASWNTTVKTGDFTAVAGEGYFVDTTSQAIDVTLPAGTAGAVIAIKDYAGTFDTNKVTLVRNGSDKIGGLALNSVISTEGLAITLVFIDSTQGWLVTDSGLQSEAPGPEYVTASGGTPSTCGDFKIHTFTGPGTFCVSAAGNAAGNNQLEYIVVAGGGGGGSPQGGGGGGAGGFRFASPSLAPLTYPGKPLAAPAALTASVSSFPIVVGGGGAGTAGPSTRGVQGSTSSFSTISSAGGGGGGTGSPGVELLGGSGGSGGGGGGRNYPNPNAGGAGNTPPVSPAQGTSGGRGRCTASPPSNDRGGGGGGAISAGTAGAGDPGNAGPGGGGAGIPTAFGSNGVPCGSFRYYAGGGGGGLDGGSGTRGAGGLGGGGDGSPGSPTGAPGTVNTGGGGGGSGTASCTAAAGGSGIVIIRYKFQN
jgi:hypothetical protein